MDGLSIDCLGKGSPPSITRDAHARKPRVRVREDAEKAQGKTHGKIMRG